MTDQGSIASGDDRVLYPEIEPFRKDHLRVSDRHQLYFEEAGRPDGEPILFVHGGPGGATSPKQRRFFDPNHYRIILFDQRGCGRSTPHASLEENTTWNLVEDMELLRKHLDVERWQLFGGSWGSTLALAYAEKYPERVSACVLRGIFMLRRSEIRWFYQDGASHLFPDAWEDYLAQIPESEHGDLVTAYNRRLTSSDSAVRISASRAWTRWEKSCSYLIPRPDAVEEADDVAYSEAFARIECHYFVHTGFFEPETQLLDQIDRIRHIPSVIVQGRYDLVCPMRTAWELHRAWPEADFRLVSLAGHSAYDPDIQRELVAATDAFRFGT